MSLNLKLSDHERAKQESFLNDELMVTSRSGLNITEVLLLNAHEDWKPKEKVLVIENRSTVLPMAITQKSSEVKVIVQCFDHFYAEQINKRLSKWGKDRSITCRLDADLPEEQFDEIYLQVTQSISAEFVAELLQESYQRLSKDGRLFVSSERQHRHTDLQIQKLFGRVTYRPGKQGSLWIIKKKKDLKKLKEFVAEFDFSIPAGEALHLKTRPGVFSHRRVDEGAQALAECMEIKNNDYVMELGCGHGGVGLFAKKLANKIDLVLVDSHTRAMECAKLNAEANQLAPIKTVLSSSGLEQSLGVDVFLGNPPYFSDHSISKLFIDQAHFHLKKGGSVFLVAKNMDWNLEYAQTLFEACEVISRRNYKVLKAIKKS